MKALIARPFVAFSILVVLGGGALAQDEADESVWLRAYAKGVSALTGRIEDYIAKRLVDDLGYCETPQSRQYLMHDIDGDKKDDLLLITSFGLPSGGNYEQSELLVVLSSDPTNVRRVTLGGRGSRIAKRMFVDNGGLHVFITFSVWARTDAQCCPSLSSTEELVVESGKLKFLPYDQIKRKG